MRWLTFLRDGRATFGYVASNGQGVVDVGARSTTADLRSAIAAGALTDLAESCGDEVYSCLVAAEPDLECAEAIHEECMDTSSGCLDDASPIIGSPDLLCMAAECLILFNPEPDVSVLYNACLFFLTALTPLLDSHASSKQSSAGASSSLTSATTPNSATYQAGR